MRDLKLQTEIFHLSENILSLLQKNIYPSFNGLETHQKNSAICEIKPILSLYEIHILS